MTPRCSCKKLRDFRVGDTVKVVYAAAKSVTGYVGRCGIIVRYDSYDEMIEVRFNIGCQPIGFYPAELIKVNQQG